MERKKHLTRIAGIVILLAFNILALKSYSQTVFSGSKTFEYSALISAYKQLIQPSAKLNASLDSIGPTDSGKPLYVLTIWNKNYKTVAEAKANGCVTLFVNNGIHPGESCGIEASYLFAKNILSGNLSAQSIPQNIIYCIVPVFNVGGMLNRNCCTRSNQNGPEAYGFRGSSKNLDLNRDFIKCDALETQSLTSYLRKTDPDVFVDTHTSDGADYTYTMTLIETQRNKLIAPTSSYQQETLTPALYNGMAAKGNEMAPYVDFKENTLASGLVDFLDIPRFSTGYTTLFHCFGYVTEAHMLKPFEERVNSTLQFLNVMDSVLQKQAKQVIESRNKAKEACAAQSKFEVKWTLDTTNFGSFNFKGFKEEEVYYPDFELTAVQYNTNKPIDIKIPYYKTYTATKSIEKPSYYIIPQQWQKAIHLLQNNGIVLERLKRDTTISVETYRIQQPIKNRNAYEGHYLHTNISAEKSVESIQFFAGDFLVKMGSPNDYFILSVLEPEAVDSYFAWNFFDEILMQKEYYSNYLILPQFAQKLKTDLDFKATYDALKAAGLNGDELLYKLYQSSEAYEKTYLRYPVYRIK